MKKAWNTPAFVLLSSFFGEAKNVQRKAPHANQPTPPRPHRSRKGRWRLFKGHRP